MIFKRSMIANLSLAIIAAVIIILPACLPALCGSIPLKNNINSPGSSSGENLLWGDYSYAQSGQNFTTGSSGGMPAPMRDLTGIWNCDAGGKFYLRQIGNSLLWYGESDSFNPSWSNVMCGTISGSTINGNWADVPKGGIMQNGMIVLKIESANRLVATHKTGGFAGSVWTR